MPSERPARVVKCFTDMIAAIDLIDGWIRRAGGVDPALHEDTLLRSAVERQLLIISEAAIRLHKIDPAIAETHAPEIDWAGVRGIGNFIRHRYDDLDRDAISTVVSGRLGELRAACERAASALG